MQRQLWQIDRETASPSVLNLSYAVSIEGRLDPESLRSAFRDVVRQRTPLRTTYRLEGGRAIAEVEDEALADAALDLAPRRVQEDEAAELALADRLRGFDLEREAPIRASLLELGPERHVLLLTLHHIAVDGWSLRLLSNQLSRAYSARLRQEAAFEEPDPGECLDHARYQREWLTGPEAERESLWWIDQLRDASPGLETVPAEPRDAVAAMRRHVVVVPDPLTMELRTRARKATVSVFGLLLAAFEALVGRWSDCETPLLGTLTANRTTPASAEMLGAHYNPLLVMADLRGDPSLADCILRVSRAFVAALDHQALPYAVLCDRLDRELGWNGAAVPAAMLLSDRYPLEQLRLDGCRVVGLHLDAGEPVTPLDGGGPPGTIPAASVADLSFFVREVGDRLTVSALAPPARVEEASAIALLQAYLEMLAALCDAPERALCALDVELGEPPRHASRAAAKRPGLGEIVAAAPAEALSPVGRWADGIVDDW